MGGYLLARGRKLAPSLSVMVALVAALNGWIICWGATDWFGALGAFAWLPWAWWGLERALKVAPASSRCSEEAHRQDADATKGRRSEKDHRQDTDATTTCWRFLWPAPFVYLVVT